MLEEPLRALGARSGDVVVVTQKVVSKAEGRVVPDGDRAGWVERETERVVARRGDLTIAATRHGFVCANAGVDASNVDGGGLTLLPVDPDGSAERIRSALTGSLAIEDLGVVITDTFGRAWREGVINVAIGVAGIPALIDLRGAPDHTGRELEAAIAEAWRADLRGDATPEDVIARRIANSDAVLGQAPVLIVPWVSFSGSHPYGDAERSHAEQEMFLLSGGAAIQNLLLALHAQGLASCWISSTLFCQEDTRGVLDMDDGWFALGTVACGRLPEGGAGRPRPPIDLTEFARFDEGA